MNEDQAWHILRYDLDKRMKERLLRKLDIAEAFQFSYIGSQPKPKNKANRGLRVYRSWQKKLIRLIMPKDKNKTLWDSVPRKRGKRKLTYKELN